MRRRHPLRRIRRRRSPCSPNIAVRRFRRRCRRAHGDVLRKAGCHRRRRSRLHADRPSGHAVLHVEHERRDRPAIMESQTNWIAANRADAQHRRSASSSAIARRTATTAATPSNGRTPTARSSTIENPIDHRASRTASRTASASAITTRSPGGNAAGTTTFYNQFFGEARFQGRAYYGGHYGTNNDNHFELFSASGMDFIVIRFEYDTSPMRRARVGRQPARRVQQPPRRSSPATT